MKKHFSILTFLVCLTSNISAMLDWNSVEIPMSDGQSLAADIYLPEDWTAGPVILIQTPYWKDLYHLVGLPMGIFYNQEEMDYAIVIVDWRGFFGSTSAAYPGSPTRGEDGYDVVEWIAEQEWSNGKVGTWGPSALGRVQFLTAREHPPHLICMIPQVASPLYTYQEYYANGAAKTEYLEQLDALGFGTSPVIYANPYFNLAWMITESTNEYPDEIDIPTFMIGGWYDHNVTSMMTTFEALQSSSAPTVQDQHRLLMGPWVHGGSGTAIVGSNAQGELEYPQAEGWSDSLAFVFFDYHLKNIENGWDQSSMVQYFQMGDDEWLNAESWPVPGSANTRLFLHEDMSLQTSLPATSPDLAFSYDPQDPSPTIGGPTLRTDLEQGPLDQTDEVENRNDILVFSSNVLDADVVVKGIVKAHLTITTDVPDTDIAVRLCDVYPDDRSMLVGNGIYRLRFLNGFDEPNETFLTSGSEYEVEIEFPTTAITFKAGHRIRLDITGSNYPMYNRNMNTGGEMYPNGNGDTLVDPIIAHNVLRLSTTNQNGSFLDLPLAGEFPSQISESAQSSLNLYPNPASDQIIVEGSGEIVRVYDMSNKLVMEKSIQGNKTEIDIRNLSKGKYMVVIINGEEQCTESFIKMGN